MMSVKNRNVCGRCVMFVEYLEYGLYLLLCVKLVGIPAFC